MKRLGTIILLLFSAAAHATSAWSTFLDVASKGKPPKSLDELDTFISKARGESIIFVEMTPSRSSQKNRTVKAFSFRGKKIFVGYSEDKDELEIISEDVGSRPPKNTFEVYKPLKSAEPKHEEKDGRCLGCHQHGGPIFSRDPWREAPRSRGSAALFDRAVRDANAELQARQVCAAACAKDDWECRAAIVSMALTGERDQRWTISAEEFFEAAASKKAEPELERLLNNLPPKILGLQKKLEQTWPADGFAYISSVIRDRTPDGKKTALIPGKTASGETLQFSDDIANLEREQRDKETFETDPAKARALADPRAERPLTRAIPKAKALAYLSNVSLECLGLRANHAGIRNLTTEQITKALASTDLRKLLRNDEWPATGDALWSAIQKGIGPKAEKGTTSRSAQDGQGRTH